MTIHVFGGRATGATEVGSSADVSCAAQMGTPSIGGFGIEGGGAHSADDYADLGALVPRVCLLARLLMDVGHNPKGL
jgi:glutamate carboxypeptidase